jgi:hypothetical protein
MNRIASVSLFGIALAIVLALGIPGKANAFVNDNGTNGRLILAGDLGITIGEGGIGITEEHRSSESSSSTTSSTTEAPPEHCVSHCRHHYEERMRECNDPGHEHHHKCEEWAREREKECLNTCR